MKQKKMQILLPLVFLLFLLSPLTGASDGDFFHPPAYENGSRLDYEACRQLVINGVILPISELMELAKQHSDDHILDAYLIKENDRYYYQIESVGSNGVVNNFSMDASNGEVIIDIKVFK